MKTFLKLFVIFLVMCGVFAAEQVKEKSMMEGDSVTLNPDLTQIQRIIQMQWRFGDPGPVIAQIEEKEISYTSDKGFIDRLQLDQTGSLVIKNMKTNHSGIYKLEINTNKETLYETYRVTVYESPSVIDAGEAERQLMSVMEGDSVTLNIPQLQGNELIVWRSGDDGKLIAKLDIETKSSPLYYDERFRDRLELDQTGSLIITNTRTTDSGLYRVKISSNKQTLYKRFTVTVSEPGLSSAAVAGIICACLILVLAATAAGVFFYLRTKSEVDKQNSKISERQDETLAISEKLKEMSEISTKLAEDCEKELPDVLEHHQTSRISEKLKEMLKDSKRLKELSKHCEKELCKISDRLKEMSSKKKGQNSEQETPLVDAMINEDQETGDEGEKKGPVIMKTLL